MIDAMPIDSGRSADDLAEVSRRTEVQIVAATGLHLRLYYPPDHWYDRIDEDALTARFVDEIENGVTDEGRVSTSRAGVIKVAGSLDRLTDLERRNFAAAGQAQRITGCPILTHTEQGTAAFEQIRLLQGGGADLKHVVLSHLDRCDDAGYHREVLATGVRLEYDSAFRWKGERNPTRALLLELAPEFSDSLMLGMDAAKPAYWSSFGGKPGLAFLISEFGPALVDGGLTADLLDGIFVRNPASAYSFIDLQPRGESR
jgi:phosphotriesterase-related protein